MKLYYLAVAEGERGRENLLYLYRFARKTGVLEMVRLAPTHLFLGVSVPRIPGGTADYAPPPAIVDTLQSLVPSATPPSPGELQVVDNPLIDQITARFTPSAPGIRVTVPQIQKFLSDHLGEYILGIEIG